MFLPQKLNKLIGITFLSLIICNQGLAQNSDISLDEVKKKVALIESTSCPSGQSIQDEHSSVKSINWVKKKLSCMVEADQYVVFLRIDHPNDKILEKYQNDLNIQNTWILKKILKQHGWINISKFGRKADNNAWLLVQHADHDPEFQASVAFLLENLVDKNETNPKNFAYLYDRVALKYQILGLKQKYGTQFTSTGTDLKLQPYEGTMQELNQRRKNIGLPSAERYLNQAKAIYLEK